MENSTILDRCSFHPHDCLWSDKRLITLSELGPELRKMGFKKQNSVLEKLFKKNMLSLFFYAIVTSRLLRGVDPGDPDIVRLWPVLKDFRLEMWNSREQSLKDVRFTQIFDGRFFSSTPHGTLRAVPFIRAGETVEPAGPTQKVGECFFVEINEVVRSLIVSFPGMVPGAPWPDNVSGKNIEKKDIQELDPDDFERKLSAVVRVDRSCFVEDRVPVGRFQSFVRHDLVFSPSFGNWNLPEVIPLVPNCVELRSRRKGEFIDLLLCPSEASYLLQRAQDREKRAYLVHWDEEVEYFRIYAADSIRGLYVFSNSIRVDRQKSSKRTIKSDHDSLSVTVSHKKEDLELAYPLRVFLEKVRAGISLVKGGEVLLSRNFLKKERSDFCKDAVNVKLLHKSFFIWLETNREAYPSCKVIKFHTFRRKSVDGMPIAQFAFRELKRDQ